MRRYSRQLLAMLQVIGSVVLLWWVLRGVAVDDLIAGAARLSAFRLALAFGVFLLSYLLTVGVWFISLQTFGVILPYGQVFRAHLIGYFYGTVIPSSLSSDVGRGLRLRGTVPAGRAIALSILLDRLSGGIVLGVVLVMMTPFFVPLLPFDLGVYLSGFLEWAALILGGGLALLAVGWFFRERLRPYWVWVGRYWRVTLVMAVLSLLVHVLVALMFWVLILPFSDAVSVGYGLYLLELSQVAELLPISFAGLGIREGLYVVMLEPLGVARADAITVALVQFGMYFAWSLVGGLLELVNGVRGFRTPSAARHPGEQES